MPCAILVIILFDEALPPPKGVPGYFILFFVTPGGLSGEKDGNGSTMNAPMDICPPIGVPSEALSDDRSYSLFQRTLATRGYGGLRHEAQVWFCALQAR